MRPALVCLALTLFECLAASFDASAEPVSNIKGMTEDLSSVMEKKLNGDPDEHIKLAVEPIGYQASSCVVRLRGEKGERING